MTSIALEIQKPNRLAITQNFNDGLFSIGRESGDIVLGDTQVSSRHAELKIENGTVTFTDLDSTNGSFVKGDRITGAYPFAVGDEIQMGNCTIVLKKIDLPAPKGKTELAPAMKQPAPIAPTQAVPRIPAPTPAPTPVASPATVPVASSVAAPVVAPVSTPVVAATPPASQSPEAQQAIVFESSQTEEEERTTPGTDGLFADFMEMLRWAFHIISPHIVRAAMPIALLTIPLPLIIAVLGLFIFIVPVLGPLLLFIVGILTLIASIPIALCVVLIIYPVIGRFMIALYRGKPVTMKQAWQEYKQDFGANVLTTFVNTLIGGFTIGLLGVFIFQIPPVEGKSMVDVNMRSWELFKNCWQRVLFIVIGTAIVFFVPAQIVFLILGIIPIIGPIVVAILSGLVTAVYVPTILLILTRIYFETRRSIES